MSVSAKYETHHKMFQLPQFVLLPLAVLPQQLGAFQPPDEELGDTSDGGRIKSPMLKVLFKSLSCAEGVSVLESVSPAGWDYW